MSRLLGNVYQPGEKARLSVLEVRRDSLQAVVKDDESIVFQFPLREEFMSFAGDEGSQVVLKNPEGITLVAERSVLEAPLKAAGNHMLSRKLESEGSRVRRSNVLSWAGLLGFIFLCVGVVGLGVLGLNWGVDRVVDQIPVTWEEKLGDLVVSQGVGEIVDDPRVVEPVQAVLERLVAATPDQPYSMDLHIVKSDQVNAFAAPGGQIVVFTGLLARAETPDELAGVLAHELQHVYHRHGLRGMVHRLKWHLVAALVVGDVGSVQQMLLGYAPQFASLSYGRSLEEEADLDGIKLLCEAHLDPRGMVSFFEVLKENDIQGVPEFLSSHPDTAGRIASLEHWISENSGCRPAALDLDWQAMQKALAEITEGETSPAAKE